MAPVFKDYYAVLGVARDASPADIKRAFRNLARLHHPDVARDKSSGDARFKEINEANEVLGDPAKRKKYDLLGSAPPADFGSGPDAADADPAFHFGGTGFSDFFERYFSGGSRYGFGNAPDAAEASRASAASAAPRRGADIEGDLLVSLGEAMRGAERPVSLRIANRDTGRAETRSFTVRIPPGAVDGCRLRVPAHGEPGRAGGGAGDLFLRVRHAAHPDFTTRGADVFHELEVAPWEAVLGASVTVPTLDGAIKLSIPPDSAPGRRIRARGRGLPLGKSGARGDFYVVLDVCLPPAADAAERALWENLRDHSSFHPRANRPVL